MKTIFRYVIVFVLTSGILVLVLDKIVMPGYVSHYQGRYLPDVRGLPYEEAKYKLGLEGFKAMLGDVKYTSKFVPGTVIDQYPKAMRRVKPGRRIRLTLAEKEKMIPIPAVVGKSIRSARLEIEETGLQIDSVMSEYDAEVPKDVIKWQYPKPGDFLRRGSGLTLIISKGKPPDFYQVPQLFGLSLEKARKLLIVARLKVGRITYRQNEDLVPYTVLDQSVEAETILDHPIKVDIIVSILNLNDLYNKLSQPE